MWEAIVCLKNPHFEWHAQDCMFGTCGNCGVDNMALYPNEETWHLTCCTLLEMFQHGEGFH